MKIFANRRGVWLASAALFLGIAAAGAVVSAEEVNAKTMVDRLQIQDLITRYYNNFGKENAENFADFYSDDAELILGERHFKGRKASCRPTAVARCLQINLHARLVRSVTPSSSP